MSHSFRPTCISKTSLGSATNPKSISSSLGKNSENWESIGKSSGLATLGLAKEPPANQTHPSIFSIICQRGSTQNSLVSPSQPKEKVQKNLEFFVKQNVTRNNVCRQLRQDLRKTEIKSNYRYAPRKRGMADPQALQTQHARVNDDFLINTENPHSKKQIGQSDLIQSRSNLINFKNRIQQPISLIKEPCTEASPNVFLKVPLMDSRASSFPSLSKRKTFQGFSQIMNPFQTMKRVKFQQMVTQADLFKNYNSYSPEKSREPGPFFKNIPRRTGLDSGLFQQERQMQTLPGTRKPLNLDLDIQQDLDSQTRSRFPCNFFPDSKEGWGQEIPRLFPDTGQRTGVHQIKKLAPFPFPMPEKEQISLEKRQIESIELGKKEFNCPRPPKEKEVGLDKACQTEINPLTDLLSSYNVKRILDFLGQDEHKLKHDECLMLSVTKKVKEPFEYQNQQENTELLKFHSKHSKHLGFNIQMNNIMAVIVNQSINDRKKHLSLGGMALIMKNHFFKLNPHKINQEYSKVNLRNCNPKLLKDLAEQLLSFEFDLEKVFGENNHKETFLLVFLVYNCMKTQVLTNTSSINLKQINRLKTNNELTMPLVLASFLLMLSHFMIKPHFLIAFRFFSQIFEKLFGEVLHSCKILLVESQIQVQFSSKKYPSDLKMIKERMPFLVKLFLNQTDNPSREESKLRSQVFGENYMLSSILIQYLDLFSYLIEKY